MKKLLALLPLLLIASASGQSSLLHFGFGFGQVPTPAPLSRGLVQSNSGTFTFLGSFKISNNSLYQDNPGGMSITDGSTLYVGSNLVDPSDTNNIAGAHAVGAVIVPTLTGAAALDGSNGTTSISVTPNGPVSYIASATACPTGCTLTSAPSAGATTATLNVSTIPAGFGANSGWYVRFSNNQDKVVTSWNPATNVFGWSGGLTVASTTAVTIHKFLPLYPFGQNSGDAIEGSLAYGGHVYITDRPYYGDSTLGFIAQGASDLSSFGGVYVPTNPFTGCVTAANCSRRYAGSLNLVPAAWQSILGGPAYIAQGQSFAVIGSQSAGLGFTTFDPSAIAPGAGSVALNKFLDYYWESGTTTAQYVKQMTMRSSAGPFPCGSNVRTNCTNTNFYPATITGGNGSGPNGLTGATHVTLSLPTAVVNVTANVTNTGCNQPSSHYCNFNITAINSGGPIANNGMQYSLTVPLPGNGPTWINPGFSAGPGVTAGTGINYKLFNPSPSGGTVTTNLTPAGFDCTNHGAYYRMTFSDGETRDGHLNCSSGATMTFPIPYGGGNVPADNIDPSSFAALTCVSCTTSVTLAPLGDDQYSDYNSTLGTAFIAPNSRSLLFVTMSTWGPTGPAFSDQCEPGASATFENPLPPDTKPYVSMQVIAFDLQDLVNANNGSTANTNCPVVSGQATTGLWAPCAYGRWDFPGSESLKDASGCLVSNNVGWAAYDETKSVLYAMFLRSGFAGNIVYEWKVNSL